MSACSQCGTVVKPADKFCNVCGSPIPRSAAPPAGNAAYVAPASPPTYPSERERGAPVQYAPTPAAAYPPPASQPAPAAGAQAPAHCQAGHEIVPGGSYCAQGHPVASDPLPFANDPYGFGYGHGPPPSAYGPAPRAQGAFAAPASPSFGGPSSQRAQVPPAHQAAYASAFGVPASQPAFPPPPVPTFAAQPVYVSAPAAPPPAFSADAAPPRVLRGFLVAYGTNPGGDFWPLTAGRHTIGRFGAGDGLDIALQDPTISSRHAALVVDGVNGAVGIEDTGSTNGTFVNDEHIGYGGRRELRDGDRVRLGGFTTIVKVIGRV